jgi:hypothetical protein
LMNLQKSKQILHLLRYVYENLLFSNHENVFCVRYEFQRIHIEIVIICLSFEAWTISYLHQISQIQLNFFTSEHIHLYYCHMFCNFVWDCLVMWAALKMHAVTCFSRLNTNSLTGPNGFSYYLSGSCKLCH